MPEIVTIPASYFELEMEYAQPNLRLWLDRINVVEAVYAALQPWNIAVDDVEVISTGKPSEQGIKFKIPEKLCSFFFGAASSKFTRDSASWETADETIEIVDAAVTALIGQTSAQIAKRKAIIVLHAQPKSLQFIQILAPFAPAKLVALESDPLNTMATVVKWGKRKITLDGSAQIANAIFIRFDREFAGTVSYMDIAKQLRLDENEIFNLLEIQEET